MRLLLFIAVLLALSPAFSQENERFNLVLSGGGVGSQVDGDFYGGYDKFGPYGGIYLNRAIGEKVSIDFGLTYIQKGARHNASQQDPTGFYISRLNYVEMPLLFSGYYKKKYRFEGGLTVAYLFKSHEESAKVGVINTGWKSYDVGYAAGFGYKLSDKVYTNLRYNYSLVPIRAYQANVYLGTFWTRLFNKGLYNNLIQLSINYIISPKEKNSEQ
ncbi:MAG TPA: outer membrane beta-barrel protein [Bacteroidia bacterium]